MVQQLYLSMQEIKDASKSVGTITSVIDEIAFQTNLLSLNAAVEAARAGESGKGFAVVAAEVRQLAQRSSTAASEISELIGNSMQKIGKGGELADSARDALNEVEASVRSVTDVMGELSDSSQEQAGDIENISAMVRVSVPRHLGTNGLYQLFQTAVFSGWALRPPGLPSLVATPAARNHRARIRSV